MYKKFWYMQIPANINPYWLLIKDLNAADKLSLIELLVKSVKAETHTIRHKKSHTPAKGDDWVLRFAGSWSDFPETAEEMIDLIEKSRTLSRPIESL